MSMKSMEDSSLDMVGVTGSIPVAPTKDGQQLASNSPHPPTNTGQQVAGGWIPADTPPQDRGRYAIIYQYADLAPAYFTADWDEVEGGWQSMIAPNRVLYWMPYPEMPIGATP